MRKKEAVMIVNPIAGTRSKEHLEEKVSTFLSPRGINVSTCFTTGPGNAATLARGAVASGADIIISAGGDGTLNEIAGELVNTDTALGILPIGSGNGLARTLGISQELKKALETIAGQNFFLCDRGKVNKIPFYCTFGVGLDAAVSEKFNSMKRRGRTMYLISFLKEVIHYKPHSYTLSVNGETITEEALLIAVCNASQYGNNVYIAPSAKLSDGLLDIIVVHRQNAFLTMKAGMELITGFLDKDTRIDTFRASKASISMQEELPVHVDGDPHRLGRHLDISCEPKVLKIIAPKELPVFKPVISPLKALLNDLRYEVVSRINP